MTFVIQWEVQLYCVFLIVKNITIYRHRLKWQDDHRRITYSTYNLQPQLQLYAAVQEIH